MGYLIVRENTDYRGRRLGYNIKGKKTTSTWDFGSDNKPITDSFPNFLEAERVRKKVGYGYIVTEENNFYVHFTLLDVMST